MFRTRIVPLIVAVALFMENMDSTIISTALPAIARDIGTNPLALKLAITSYLLALAIFIPASGWTADRFGARNVFRAAIAIFMVGSIGCAMAHTLSDFVIARFIQGMGGAMMSPVGRLVMLRSFDKREIVSVMTWVTMPALIGPILGPPVGGFITTYFTWHWIFVINIPIGLLGIALATLFIPDMRGDERVPFDFVGFALAGIGIGGLAFGLTTAGVNYFPTSVVAALVTVGTISTIAYVRHSNRTPAPLLDLSLFKLQTFRASVLGGFVFRIGVGALPFLLPLLLQLGFHMTPFESGLITFSTALGAMSMKAVVPYILRQYRVSHDPGRQRGAQCRLPRRLRCLPARYPGGDHDGGAGDRRLLPLARVHLHQHHRLCGDRPAPHEPGDVAGQRRPAALDVDRHRHRCPGGRADDAVLRPRRDHGGELPARVPVRGGGVGVGDLRVHAAPP